MTDRDRIKELEDSNGELRKVNAEQLTRLTQAIMKLSYSVSLPATGQDTPISIRLPCPNMLCNEMHIDTGEFATKPHHTHACQFCGNVWRPAVVCTVGVLFLPGFKNDPL